MLNNSENTAQQPNPNIINSNGPEIIFESDLRQRRGFTINQNPIRSLLTRPRLRQFITGLERLEPWKKTILGIGLSSMAYNLISIIRHIAKKDKSKADKTTIFILGFLALTNLAFLTKALNKYIRHLQNSSNATVASRTELEQEYNFRRDVELATLAVTPQRTNSSNSLNSSLSRFRSNDSAQNASRTRSRTLSI